MRKLTLTEWAIDNKVHYNTAKNRFKAGKIPGAKKDEYNRIFVYVDKTLEEKDLAIYVSLFWPIQAPPPPPPEKTPEQIEKEQMIREIQETQMIRPDRISKKEPKVIIPSTLEWEALKEENVKRCRELVIPYTKTFTALSRECWWTQESLSQYIDEYERTKGKITVSDFIDILIEGNKEFDEFVEREFCSHPDTPLEEQPIEVSKLRAIIDLAEKHHMDHDLVRYFFEKTECPALQGDDIVLDFLRQYPAKDLETYANDIQYPSPVV